MGKGYGYSVAEQRLMWDDLRKRINALVERVSESNIRDVGEELIFKNMVWGRGLFCDAILRSSVSPPVLGALVAVVNSKFPDAGYLLLKRILFEVRVAYESNDKVRLLRLAMLLANLVNQCVVHETVGLEFLFVVLQERIPSKEIIEIAVSFVTECGAALSESIPTKLDSVFERFGEIACAVEDLDDDDDDDWKCRLLMIEGLFDIRKSGFMGYPSLSPELGDIIETEDQVIHEISNYHDLDPEMSLDVFHPYPDLIVNNDRVFFI